MFNENLKTLRKAKGITQEELAIRLNVVRQTVSKWEKGISVPDADMLIRISEILEASVSELLGAKIKPDSDVNSIAEQLSRINEQLAIKNRRSRRVWKVIVGVIIVIVVIDVLLAIAGIFSLHSFTNDKDTSITTQTEVVVSDE